MSWLVRLIRVSVFPVADFEDWKSPTFEELFGIAAENRITPSPGTRVEDGPFGRGRVGVQRQFSPQPRADLFYRVSNTAAGSERDLGTLDEALGTIGPMARALVAGSEPIVRIALGVEQFESAQDVDAAYAILSDRISPRMGDLKGASDLIFQINRPRESGAVPGLRINRLAKWVVSQRQKVTLVPATGEFVAEGDPEVAAEVQTDVNTDLARVESLPNVNMDALLAELWALTRQIALEGDVP